jgi:CRISPR-associated protein Csx16
MTTWFVTRHPGAVEWTLRRSVRVDRQTAHPEIEQVRTGDAVIGALPVHLAAEMSRQGARFSNLTREAPPEACGREASAEELEACGARLEGYRVERSEAARTGPAGKLAE